MNMSMSTKMKMNMNMNSNMNMNMNLNMNMNMNTSPQFLNFTVMIYQSFCQILHADLRAHTASQIQIHQLGVSCHGLKGGSQVFQHAVFSMLTASKTAGCGKQKFLCSFIHYDEIYSK